MMERNDDKIKRVAIELGRFDQEVRTLQRLLDQNRQDCCATIKTMLVATIKPHCRL
jgi:hypothetical protein